MFAQRNSLIAGLILLIVLNCDSKQEANPVVLIQTDLGDIAMEIYVKKSQATARNFLRYVEEGRFADASFYRTVRADNQPNEDVRIEVVQGGIGFLESALRLPPIVHETTAETGIRHKDGVVSMARAAPGTASSEFFICIGDQPELDYGGKRNPDGQGFAAFGRVLKGMDVLGHIHGMPADGQMLVTPVRILKVYRKDMADLSVGEQNAKGK